MFGVLCAAALVAAIGTIGVGARNNFVELPDRGPVIELVICLDASGSMNGLIDAARQKLWAIVSDLALAVPTPELRVALLTYGNDGHAVRDGWVALQTPFTSDLDLVSERLFAVTTNGGTEYVGRVLEAAGALGWSSLPDAMQLILVAGNESAQQDSLVNVFRQSQDLIARGIVVNAVYCGPAEDNIAPAWREVAQHGEGTFATIDHNHGTIVIETPFDELLGTLSSELNLTYIPFGASGNAGAANQLKQDKNAAGMNAAAEAARAVTKSSAMYECSWDLVDACKAGTVVVADLDSEDLPEAMKNLSAAERQEYIDNMARTRTTIQAKIAALKIDRDAFIREEMSRKALDDSKAFDHAVRQAIRRQASSKGFRFMDETPESSAKQSSVRGMGDLKAAEARVASVAWPTKPVLNSPTSAEAKVLREIFARAVSVRPGDQRDEAQIVNSQARIVPDLVVTIGTQDDLRLIQDTFQNDNKRRIQTSAGMILRIDGQAILITDGC